MLAQLKTKLKSAVGRSPLPRLAAWSHRDQVAILCFHSTSRRDEHEFWPGVFVSPDRLQQILDFLEGSPYQPVSLGDALRHLRGEVRYEYPVVITIDDGWWTSVTDMVPALEARKIPATLYVTTHYVKHRIPVVNVCMQYLMWKSQARELRFTLDGRERHFAASNRVQLMRKAQAALQGHSDATKLAVLHEMADRLGVDASIFEDRLFELASFDELQPLVDSPYIDLQLHTHRHQVPEHDEALAEELVKNRKLLQQGLEGLGALEDFCYPSGVWRPSQLDTLRTLGLRSATTLDGGLNRIGCDPLTLKRTLVSNDHSLAQLRLGMSGLEQSLRGRLRRS